MLLKNAAATCVYRVVPSTPVKQNVTNHAHPSGTPRPDPATQTRKLPSPLTLHTPAVNAPPSTLSHLISTPADPHTSEYTRITHSLRLRYLAPTRSETPCSNPDQPTMRRKQCALNCAARRYPAVSRGLSPAGHQHADADAGTQANPL